MPVNLGPRFDQKVPPGGYLWWYLDGLSADGKFGITIICFVGSVFSPYYYWSGRKDPENHVCINVALYGPHSNRWTMTERSSRALSRSAEHFSVGQSEMRWDGEALTLDLNERAVPHLSRVRGKVRLVPDQLTTHAHELAPAHHWHPHAPSARIEVQLDQPDVNWQGHGYLDQNWGEEPIEAGFKRWDWMRAEGLPGGAGAVLYAGERRDGSPFSLGLRFPGDGSTEKIEVPPTQKLKRGLWGVGRSIPAAPDARPEIVRTFEDAPFYMRSQVRTEFDGCPIQVIHESLDLDRFAHPVVKLMLPFRMPRIR